MNTFEKDYVVVKHGDKMFLAQVKDKSEGTVFVIPEKDRRVAYREVEVRSKDILANLGPKPAPGKAYGFDVSNLYRKVLTDPFWGNLYFYVRLEKPVLKMLQNSLDRTAKIVDKEGLTAYVEDSDIEIRAKTGKYAGMYKHNPKGRNTTWFAPDWAQGSSEMMDYVVIHEFGHVIRYNGMANAIKLRQKWLRLYQQSVNPVVIPPKATAKIWGKLVAAREADEEVGFAEAMKDIGSEDEKYERAVKVLFKWLKQVQHVGGKELHLAWSAGDIDFIKEVWPQGAIDSSKLTPVITEYATKNVEELFAECFSLRLTKKKLPAEYSELLERSLLWAKKSALSK